MLVKCSECSGTVSDQAAACPHCGAPVELSRPLAKKGKTPERGREPENTENEEDSYVPPPQKQFDPAVLFLRAVKFCFLLLTLFIIFGSLFFFLIRYDIGGVTSKLRKIAESDAADGSHIDKSSSRVMFKYRLASFLDAVQGKETKPDKKTESPKQGNTIETAIQLPDGEQKTEELPTPKKERKPIELPPPPPDDTAVK